MSTARTCTTSKDGWGLYSHFLGNLLLVIGSQEWNREEEESEDQKNKRERAIDDTWAQLAGNLYMIMRRMKINGHDDDATKMQQIIDMVVEQDLTDPNVREAIHAKHAELSVRKQEFDRELARLFPRR